MRRVLTPPTAAAALAAVAVLLIAFTAGVAAAPDTGSPVAAPDTDVASASNIDVSSASDSDATRSASASECTADDGNEQVGCWNGTHYEDELEFNQSDGLNESELSALTDLTMARVEHVRERPFREDVPVETVTRSEYANDTSSEDDGNESYDRWNDQVWRALFVVGDDESANDEIDSAFGGSVSGFYSPGEDRIIIVVPDDEPVQIDSSTLAHELLHAMQDQYHDLTDPRYVGETQDADLAVDGIIEGEAVHVEERYAARCAANWSCIDGPDGDDGGDSSDFNFGILQTILQPYGDGALYVEELVEEDGWSAVNETMNDPPESTAEVIHRDPDYETRDPDYEDNATGGWETYEDQGVDGAETAGEASMFVMFWYQSLEYGHAVLDPDASAQENVRIHTQTDASLETRDTYNYAHPVTEGWVGDELYPYQNGDRDGYVWATEWETESDAEDFESAYVRMLSAHGGDDYEDGTVYAIEDDGDEEYPGAYGVERDGTSVTISHAPSPEGVLELRPDADLALPDTDGDDGNGDTDGDDGGDSDDGDDGGDSDDGDDGGDSDDGDDGGDSDDGDGTTDSTPGFGALATLVALVSALAVLARRSA